jgi:hypothetical protein
VSDDGMVFADIRFQYFFYLEEVHKCLNKMLPQRTGGAAVVTEPNLRAFLTNCTTLIIVIDLQFPLSYFIKGNRLIEGYICLPFFGLIEGDDP